MATVKHHFHSGLPDGSDPSLLQPSHWDADHDVTLGADENFVSDAEKAALHPAATGTDGVSVTGQVVANTDKGSTAVTLHNSAYAHADIAHSNRTALDLVSGTNTGDQTSVSGNSGGLAAQYIDWSASTGGASIANKPTIPNLSAPGAIGDTIPAAGTFTTLTATSFHLGGLPTGQTGEISMPEDPTNGTNVVGFKAPTSVPADKLWVLPATDGTSGQALTTNGSGTLFFTTLEPDLGTPDADGKVLSSTAAGVRSWVTGPDANAPTTISLTVANGINFVAGGIGRLSSSGGAVHADADAQSTAEGLLVMAPVAITGNDASHTFTTQGVVTGLSGLTVGATYYISTTAGEITATMPSSAGNIGRVVGYALSATSLLFHPDQTFIER